MVHSTIYWQRFSNMTIQVSMAAQCHLDGAILVTDAMCAMGLAPGMPTYI